MDMEAALRARLIGDTAVAALVGSRVSWVQRPQAADYPAITLQMIDDPREQHLKGVQTLQKALVQIDVWATTHKQGWTIKEAVIAALLPEATQSGVKFWRSFVTSRDLSEQGATRFIFRPSLDFTINYSPA